MISTWDSKNPILFGVGTSKLTGQKLKSFGCKKVLVVYDKGVKSAGIVDPILEQLKENGIETVCYDNVQPDPPDWSCDEAGALGKKEACDGVLAIGGGSAMDTAKAARVLLKNPPPINDYFMVPGTPPMDETGMCPIVVIPTTAGTGSECSPGAVITDTKTGLKRILNSTLTLGIVDAELTLGLPAGITANTGIDAFCHAAEALTSTAPNEMAFVLAKEAVRLVTKYLPIAVKDGKNIEARNAMSLAASLATAGMRGPLGHIPHQFGKGISKHWHVAHGITVGLFIAQALKMQATVVPEQVKLVCDAMGKYVPENATPEQIGEIVFNATNDLLKAVNFPTFASVCGSKDEVLEKWEDFWVGKPDIWSPYKIETKEQAIEFISAAYDAY